MKLLNKIVDGAMKMAGALSQAQDHHNPEKTVTEGMPQLLRAAAARGAVLLQNNGVLPLQHGTKLALFGRCQMQGFYTGYGSGGDVNIPYTVSIYEGLKACPGVKLDVGLVAPVFPGDAPFRRNSGRGGGGSGGDRPWTQRR